MAEDLNRRPGHGPGWTAYEPEGDEMFVAELRMALAGYTNDCRKFAKLARESHFDKIHERMGLTWEEFCARKLHKSSELVEAIVVGIGVIGEDAPVPAEIARKVGIATLGKQGRPKKGEEKGSGTTFIGRGSAYLRARLARDHPDTLAALERGEFKSVRAAALTAGIVKEKTGLQLLRAAWRKATEPERSEFLSEVTQ